MVLVSLNGTVLLCHFSCLSARDIKIVKTLQNVSVTERESLTFICEVNWEDVDGKWYKDNSWLKAGDNIKIRCEGRCERLSNTGGCRNHKRGILKIWRHIGLFH